MCIAARRASIQNRATMGFTHMHDFHFSMRFHFRQTAAMHILMGQGFIYDGGICISMVEYNVVKFCRFCKGRFVVGKREARRMYCDPCEKKVAKMPNN